MKIYIQTQDNRVIAWGSNKGSDNDIELTVRDDHEILKNPFIYRYENGELMRDELYRQQLIVKSEEKSTQLSEIELLKVENEELKKRVEALEQAILS